VNLRLFRPLGLLALTLPASVRPVLAQAPAERYSLSGAQVAIYNLAGILRVEAGSGPAVAVEVTRGGADASALKIETGPIGFRRGGSRETLRVIYPDDRVVYSPLGRGSSSQVRVREDGTFRDSNGWREGREVRIAGSGRGLEAHADLRVSLPAGQQAHVYLAVGRVTVTNVAGQLSIDTHAADVAASGVAGQLDIDVGSGDVTVSDHKGDLDIDTGSGNVEVTRATGGALRLETGSGDVRATTLAGDVVKVETGSGNVTASGVASPRADIETGSGDVRLDLTGDVDVLNVDTGSGDVTLGLVSGVGAELEVETGSGNIVTDLPVEVRKWNDSSLIGRLGDGRGRVHIETGSGGVHLSRR